MAVALLLIALTLQVPVAHVDHQPTHEGVFATDAADTLHFEALLQPGGVLRVIVSDREGRPLSIDQLQALNIQVIDNGREQSMQLATDGNFVTTLALPPSLPYVATVGLTPLASAGEHVSFTFTALNVADAELILVPPTVIPPTRAGILEMLKGESEQSTAMLDGRPSHGLYVAATRVRDLALALETSLDGMAIADRTRAATAIKEAVRISWLAHMAADAGVPAQTRLGVMQMRDAIDELLIAFGERR
jgi:hypothetical protein